MVLSSKTNQNTNQDKQAINGCQEDIYIQTPPHTIGDEMAMGIFSPRCVDELFMTFTMRMLKM